MGAGGQCVGVVLAVGKCGVKEVKPGKLTIELCRQPLLSIGFEFES